MTTIIDSPVGPLLVEATDKGISRLEFHNGPAKSSSPHPHVDHLKRELDAYFRGELKRFTVPLALAGTPFQQAVWKQLAKIPYGKTNSYKDIATKLGKPAAVRAVGGANGKNKLCIIIPCHRVIAHDGTLGGYGGGLERKKYLLAVEGLQF